VISAVIPSLGGNLCDALDSVNAGSICPDEIIVCLPNESHFVQDALKYKNLTVVYAQQYGQVYQRIVGFKHAKGDYVLQLDDDILLNNRCLERLVISLEELPEHSAVSPCLFNINGESLYESKKTGLLSFYYQVINGKTGYKPGGITRAGTNFGVNPNDTEQDIVKVDWQPGGCVLHKQEELILQDYYPNKGKAYCEDLIHSFLLRKLGVDLFVNTRAKCATPINPRLSLLKEIVPDFKIRLYFVKIAGLSVTRMLLYYVVYIMRAIIK
jgi:glycosyltransferase involved in cell wall biosynthesis